MENRVSITISTETIANITKAITSIGQNLSALINLSAEDRQALPKMGDKSMAFVNKTLEYARQNPKVVPSFLDLAEFEKDVAAVTDLKKILIPLQQLVEKLDDTTLQAGSEAYTAALVFYTAIKGAARAGEPGMKTVYDDLQARFPGRGKNSAPIAAKAK
jgi:hypothetical protein